MFWRKKTGMISVCVEHAKNNDPISLQPIKQLVWKTPHHYPAKTAIVVWMKFRISQHTLNCDSSLGQEFSTQPDSLIFVRVLSVA